MSKDPGLPDSEQPLPAGVYLYSILAISSALFTVTGTYRAVIGFLTSLSLPEIVISAIAGILQLVWSDLAYCIAKPLGIVALFVMIPYLGAACSACSAFLLLLRNPMAQKFEIGRAHV